jgi:thiol-disulfide isomerase/thioredoxin
MNKMKSILSQSALLTLLLISVSAVSAAPSFQQAISDYNAGKYSQALGEFKQFATSYPTNAMSHYYMALCYQSMGNRGEAKQEFSLTDRYGDATLKGYAQKALGTLGGASSGGSGGSSGGAAGGGSSGGRSMGDAALAARPGAASPVTEVLEFYTDWCHVCKEFEPVWSATQQKVSGVQFHRYNAEDSSNASMVQKYSVHAYPTLVYLDKSGNVLHNQAGAYNTSDDFASTIKAGR